MVEELGREGFHISDGIGVSSTDYLCSAYVWMSVHIA